MKSLLLFRKSIITCIALAMELSSAFAANEPKDVVNLFGSTLSEWCRTDKIERRIDIEKLCSGKKSCRVEDKVLADYLYKKGQSDYETFCLDSYLNMFEDLIADGVSFNMTNIKTETQDNYPDGQVLTFITADIRLTGALNYEVKNLFLVRDGKISGIYHHITARGFSHLNGSLIKALQKENFTNVYEFTNGFAVIADVNHRYGVIDVKGNIVVPCKWDAVDYVGDSFARGYNYKTDDKSSCVYDLRQGGKQTPFDHVTTWIVGRAKVPTTFSEGYAVVYNKEGKCGFLHEKDMTYNNVSYEYDEISRFCDGYAVVRKNGSAMVINNSFKPVLKENSIYRFIIDRPYEGTIKVKNNNNKYGRMDLQGKIVVPCAYDNVEGFVSGLCQVEIAEDFLHRKIGFMDKQGRMIIPMGSLSGCWSVGFEDGYIEAMKEITSDYYKDGKVTKRTELRGTLVGTDGNPLPGFSWEYSGVRRFCDGLARFEQNGKSGYLNQKGEVAILPTYEFALFFGEGYACVGQKVNGKTKYGCINTDGVLVIPYIYDKTFFFDNGIATVVKDGKVGLIDAYGNSSF